MVKNQEKSTANFKSIYGGSLIMKISKTNGCFEVSMKRESNAFFQEKSVFIGSACGITLLSSVLFDISTYLIIIGLSFLLYITYESIFFISQEKVLVIKGFGYRISKESWIGKKTIFIPYEQIEKVFINEVIFRHRVIYLLSLLTKEWAKGSEDTLVPIFSNLLPRIDCLQIISRKIKCLESR